MSMKSIPVEAAVIRQSGVPFKIEQAQLGPPGDREVLVRLVAVGMCHTDVAARDQTSTMTFFEAASTLVTFPNITDVFACNERRLRMGEAICPAARTDVAT